MESASETGGIWDATGPEGATVARGGATTSAAGGDGENSSKATTIASAESTAMRHFIGACVTSFNTGPGNGVQRMPSRCVVSSPAPESAARMPSNVLCICAAVS